MVTLPAATVLAMALALALAVPVIWPKMLPNYSTIPSRDGFCATISPSVHIAHCVSSTEPWQGMPPLDLDYTSLMIASIVRSPSQTPLRLYIRLALSERMLIVSLKRFAMFKRRRRSLPMMMHTVGNLLSFQENGHDPNTMKVPLQLSFCMDNSVPLTLLSSTRSCPPRTFPSSYEIWGQLISKKVARIQVSRAFRQKRQRCRGTASGWTFVISSIKFLMIKPTPMTKMNQERRTMKRNEYFLRRCVRSSWQDSI
mmetsp:Transcript_20133/g.43944  ORF Transcript_20133/g.43944 Transcript_20133/m.43944 type:complete len:255 (-) Transcript_20133:4311-5075(-)